MDNIERSRPTDTSRRRLVTPKDEVLTRPPSLFHVLLLNDDYTPQQFVIMVLQRFFILDEETAKNIMQTAHARGASVCGVFPRDVAETKVQKVHEYIRQYELPLRFTIEQV